jgi:prophage antirepressor-like protein
LSYRNESAKVAIIAVSGLDIENAPDAIRILDDDEKAVNTMDTLGGPQTLNIISELAI